MPFGKGYEMPADKPKKRSLFAGAKKLLLREAKKAMKSERVKHSAFKAAGDIMHRKKLMEDAIRSLED
jgi:hypothetical protein